MQPVPVGPYSHTILKVLKRVKKPLTRIGIAAELREAGFAPPVKPLLPIMTKLEEFGLVYPGPTTYTPTGRPNHTWEIANGAKFRLNPKRAVAE